MKSQFVENSGPGTSPYGSRSAHAQLERQPALATRFTQAEAHPPSPLQHLQGTITEQPAFRTPWRRYSGNRSGWPKLVIHGLVHQPWFSIMKTAIPDGQQNLFSGMLRQQWRLLAVATDGTAHSLHGWFCAEWTGIPLSALLEEAGCCPKRAGSRSRGGCSQRAGPFRR